MRGDTRRPKRRKATADHRQHVIPVVQEKTVVEKTPTVRGSLQVHVRSRTREERLSIPVSAEDTEVRRVHIDRFVESPPPVRQEGDVIIVPLVEEVVVVQRRLKLREEVHLIRHTTTRHVERRVELRSEHASVSRPTGNQGDKPRT